jgi:GNAT superfamily N-acetyltransferase
MTHIRTAENSDLDFIRQCMEELKGFAFEPENFTSVYDSLMETGTYFPFIISSNEERCGFLGISILPQLHHNGKVAEILELVVLPEFRNRQIGQAALGFARELTQKENCLVLELATSQKRTDARRFYLANGFQNSHFKLTMEL